MNYSHLVKPSLSESDIESKISDHNWHHSIPFTDSVSTEGYVHYSNQLLKIDHLPDDLSGKHVLDIGPKHGFYSIEAMNRGAESVTAIDINAEREGVYDTLNEIFEFDLQLIIDDIMEHKFDREFDVVICFGVLHYIQDQKRFLDILSDLTQNSLCIDHPVTPSVRNRNSRFKPDNPEGGSWYQRKINSFAEYHAPIPTVPWIEQELSDRGFSIESKDTHVGVLLQRKLPKAAAIPSPHRYLPSRYVARAEQ
ncbi:class I SAM-dependent methyltransferase [Natronorubrum daqingense]|uniref:Methyltransferase domain-containing protein n=1 Tax=Natronorubrum daqingense TaxID=588898 RepID=A0A1N7BT05_9EURY|nr:class I SAM-dependent methyltransferase [Natronorubrum daqingense]APX96587.1 hypothetical protein BB347_08135 [Natronorubrum daqingense]SIR54422.1 Methyltransferase domain-containing protein [Natronorubrum daqingense]